MGEPQFGISVPRVEDARFVMGAGRYIANLPIQGCLHAVFVRSTQPHAAVEAVEVAAARRMPGVAGVFTASDLSLEDQPSSGSVAAGYERPILAKDRVRFVGEAIALVVAMTLQEATDAAAMVTVSYAPLAFRTDPEAAVADGAPRVFDEALPNMAMEFAHDWDVDVVADADVVVRGRFVNQRVVPVPMEPNAFLAVPGGAPLPGEDAEARVAQRPGVTPEAIALTVVASTQIPFDVRTDVAEALGLSRKQVRGVAPDVGGGFGAKLSVYPEYLAVAWAARKIAKPVRWIETRSESMVAMTHGRAQVQFFELGAKRDGMLIGLRADVLADMGAYPSNAFLPSSTYEMACGVYDIAKVAFRGRCVLTNTTPVAPYRGAGRPEATALIERAMDLLARELDMDPVALRRKNFVTAFPHTTVTGVDYDSGDYERTMDVALDMARLPDLRAEQAARRARGDHLLLGIGVATYVEITAFGGREYGAVQRMADGSIIVRTGVSPHGQGHETAMAQIAADVLEVPLDRVRVVHSDSAMVRRGEGTYASRSLQLGGAAVLQAAQQLRANESAFEEVDFDQGESTFPFGAHVAVVQVDREIGDVRLLRHIAVDDAGQILNPMLAQGQVHGGLAQGIAQALFEEMAYDERGRPIMATLSSYRIPGPAELPDFETAFTQTPTPHNPLGAKGIGEAATIGSVPAVQNAVVDALAHLGVRHVDMPCSPERILDAIDAATAQAETDSLTRT